MKRITWVFMILVLIASLLCLRCTCHNSHKPKNWTEYIKTSENYVPADTTQQIIVWRTRKDDATYLNSWLDSVHEHCGDFDITVFCGTCDSTLMLLTGNGVRTFIQSTSGRKGGGTACAGTSSCPPTGGGDTLLWSVNYPISLDYSIVYDSVSADSLPKINLPNIPKQRSLAPLAFTRHDTITVAVFDTGLDTLELNNYLYHSNIEACLDTTGLANNGWNFPKRNSNVQDDYHRPYGHGEIVSRLIEEQVVHYQQNNIKILPVKIHDSHGQSDLFSVLCGFAYAKDRGAQVINASFGYYALKPLAGAVDSSSLLIKGFIKHYLTDSNILLIAAAGNANTVDRDSSIKALFINAGLPLPLDLRNLDNINFYPASFASDPELPNVIAVTTVFETPTSTSVSRTQNYSPRVVDIGTNADISYGSDYWFYNLKHLERPVRGSSYAAPIVTGIICSHYSAIKDNVPANAFTKDNIIDYLLKPEVGVGHVNNANHKIRKGVFLRHL